MIIISTVNAKLLVIRVELNHEMDDVESILLAWFWDMDAGEVSFMRETHLLVLFLVVSRRVKIHGVGDSRVKNDKDGTPIAAGRRYLKLFIILARRND